MTECGPEVPFAAMEPEPYHWLTVYEAAFYPDKLDTAIVRYEPVLERFSELVDDADSSPDLLRRIMDEPPALRKDVLKLFARYVSPTTKTELLKKKETTEATIRHLGGDFRPLGVVREKLRQRPEVDEAIIAILDEHSHRGRSGYQLTEDFFLWFEAEFAELGWSIKGPRGAGPDLNLPDLLPGVEKDMPVDFALSDAAGTVRAIGFARYDTDRGGSQEDDRIGGNVEKLTPLIGFNGSRDAPVKVLYLNDGLGLTLGSMWRDYGEIERIGDPIALVTTLKMAQAGRVSVAWLDS